MTETSDRIYGNTIKYLLTFTLTIILATLSFVSFSTTGYTLTKYPKIKGDNVICVEGEVHPTNQTITLVDPEGKVVDPWVRVNGILHSLNGTQNSMKRIDDLKLGCNHVEYGGKSDTKYNLRISYSSHWRPVIVYLEIGNLRVGHSVRFFLATQDAHVRRIEAGRLNITDVTRQFFRHVFYGEFNGSAVRYTMNEPGNYKASMQVYDGAVWSDVYEVGFTSHIITTEEQKRAYRAYMLEDDQVLEYEGILPIESRPDDPHWLRPMKRMVAGGYILTERASDLSLHLLNELIGLIKEKTSS